MIDADRWYRTNRRALALVAAEGLHFVEAMEVARARDAIEEARRAERDGEPSRGSALDACPIPRETAA